MNSTNYGHTNQFDRRDLILLKISGLGCGCLLLIGCMIFTASGLKTISKSEPQEPPKRGDGRREMVTPTPKPKQAQIIVKKPQQAIEIEQGSAAWYCIKNNGGDGCLSRDRFAPNYKIVQPEKSYEDYLIQYGIRESGGGCDRYFNGKPNCL